MRSCFVAMAVLTTLAVQSAPVAAQSMAVSTGVPPYPEPIGTFQRSSADLPYWACDGMNFLPRYVARWQEDQFAMSRIDGGDTRTDGAVYFVDWTMTCWSARWDPKQNAFVIKRLPGEQDEHVDTELHVLTHDLSPWTAMRAGSGWSLRPGRFLPPALPASAAAQAPYGAGAVPAPYGYAAGPAPSANLSY